MTVKVEFDFSVPVDLTTILFTIPPKINQCVFVGKKES